MKSCRTSSTLNGINSKVFKVYPSKGIITSSQSKFPFIGILVLYVLMCGSCRYMKTFQLAFQLSNFNVGNKSWDSICIFMFSFESTTPAGQDWNEKKEWVHVSVKEKTFAEESHTKIAAALFSMNVNLSSLHVCPSLLLP